MSSALCEEALPALITARTGRQKAQQEVCCPDEPNISSPANLFHLYLFERFDGARAASGRETGSDKCGFDFL